MANNGQYITIADCVESRVFALYILLCTFVAVRLRLGMSDLCARVLGLTGSGNVVHGLGFGLSILLLRPLSFRFLLSGLGQGMPLKRHGLDMTLLGLRAFPAPAERFPFTTLRPKVDEVSKAVAKMFVKRSRSVCEELRVPERGGCGCGTLSLGIAWRGMQGQLQLWKPALSGNLRLSEGCAGG